MATSRGGQRTMKAGPCCAAHRRGVMPSWSLRELTLALCLIRSSAMLAFPVDVALMRAVWPSESTALMEISAPFRSRTCTTDECPCAVASLNTSQEIAGGSFVTLTQFVDLVKWHSHLHARLSESTQSQNFRLPKQPSAGISPNHHPWSQPQLPTAGVW